MTTATNVYWYPLAYLIFEPVEPVAYAPRPTANSLNPRGTCADMGSASGTHIDGLVYSGGLVEFDPIMLNGGVVASSIQTQSSASSYAYPRVVRRRDPAAGPATG